ncbi:hypothetical protein DOFOFD_11835 [Acetobacteraceae bacterium EV16P]|uniref:Fe-S cluster assembly protein SufB n=1 Tax=Sorlinia euscelidii TaxID=3081148 RepID=A0ABU7U4N8_9PROT
MSASTETRDTIESLAQSGYKWGFETDIDMEMAPKGLDEDIIRYISARKDEPQWMLDWRLQAYKAWTSMAPPQWQKPKFPPIDFQDAHYFAQPKKKPGPKSLEEVDPELLKTYAKLGIPLHEQAILAGVEGADAPADGQRPPIAVDAVFDSVSVVTTFRETLRAAGVIFCPISEAIREHSDLVKKYLGSVVPVSDNFYAALNSAVFTDGSFVFVPKGVKCPMELSTYFRINARNTGQFERTLIICEDGASVSYLEGCTAPMRVMKINFMLRSWSLSPWMTPPSNIRPCRTGIPVMRKVEAASIISSQNAAPVVAVTPKSHGRRLRQALPSPGKYPSCILAGDGSVGEFYSVAVTNNHQQADTGTKMIHLAPNTRSTIIAKTISAGHSDSTYRGLVRMTPRARNARNFSQCDSLLIGDQCGAHTIPYIENRNSSARVEHEATTSKISRINFFTAGPAAYRRRMRWV